MNYFRWGVVLLHRVFLMATFTLFLFPCYGMQQEEEADDRAFPKMPFRLGFEFQEGSGLCPWALENSLTQKKPLFSFNNQKDISQISNNNNTTTNSNNGPDSNKTVPLWHVVIDTSDIEFVTKPFSELTPLKQCLSFILESLSALQEIFKVKKEVTFKEWVNKIKEVFQDRSFLLAFSSDFNLVEERHIIRPSEDWKPIFGPQVTIQHPLEYTIPLYFGLLGFKNPSHMMPFVASLPFRNLFLQFHEEASSEQLKKLMGGYTKKISGLAFLHALTLVQMTPGEEMDESSFLDETLKSFQDFQQVDSKMRLTLMSRRPFSSLFKDLNVEMGYSEFFQQALVTHNHSFNHFYNVPALFHKANYAEQFFDPQTGKEKSLLVLLPFFQEDFTQKNKNTLNKLLGKGIVSTAMLRNLKQDIRTKDFLSFVNSPGVYFYKMLNSVSGPAERYMLSLKDFTIKRAAFDYDELSPPWLLDLQNSMGAFKDPMTEDEKKYGEAIVEVRGIKHVEDWFLKKGKLSQNIKGTFLTKPGENLVREAEILFKFLEEFGTHSDINDITLGMTYAVFKN